MAEEKKDPLPSWDERLMDYFVVCGLNVDLYGSDGQRGFLGFVDEDGHRVPYQAEVLDRCPAKDFKRFNLPEMLPKAVFPCGLNFYKGANIHDGTVKPRSYPIILTEGDGTKVYVSVLVFQDPVDEDFAEAYAIPPGSFADKCMCIVSHWPLIDVFRDMLVEVHRLCFLPEGHLRPIWEVISGLVAAKMPPAPGITHLFSLESRVMSCTRPRENEPTSGLSTFRALVGCLDIDNIIRLFTATLLEKRILLVAESFTLLTLVAESATALIYPYRWMSPYVPVLPREASDFLNGPGIFFYGIHPSLLETLDFDLDSVLIVNLEHNSIKFSEIHDEDESIPSLPTKEERQLRRDLLAIVHPEILLLEDVPIVNSAAAAATASTGASGRGGGEDDIGGDQGGLSNPSIDAAVLMREPWGEKHDRMFQEAFLRFFASVLHGYKDFVIEDHFSAGDFVFNVVGFCDNRCEMLGVEFEPAVDGMLKTLGWHYFFEEEMSKEDSPFDQIMRRAAEKKPLLPLPVRDEDAEFVSFLPPRAIPRSMSLAAPARTYMNTFFPPAERTKEQETLHAEGRKSSAAWLKARKLRRAMQTEPGGAKEMVKVDMHLRMLQLWEQIKALPLTENPLFSEQFATMSASIERDQEGVAGLALATGFLEVLQSGWQGEVDGRLFVAAHELLQLAAFCADERRETDMMCELLTVASRIFFVNEQGLPEYVSRHMGGLSTWKNVAFWGTYFEHGLSGFPEGTMLSVTMIGHLILADIATKMADLDLLEDDAWGMISELGLEHGLKQKRIQKLRGTVGLIFARRAELHKTSLKRLLAEIDYASNEAAELQAAAAEAAERAATLDAVAAAVESVARQEGDRNEQQRQQRLQEEEEKEGEDPSGKGANVALISRTLYALSSRREKADPFLSPGATAGRSVEEKGERWPDTVGKVSAKATLWRRLSLAKSRRASGRMESWESPGEGVEGRSMNLRFAALEGMERGESGRGDVDIKALYWTKENWRRRKSSPAAMARKGSSEVRVLSGHSSPVTCLFFDSSNLVPPLSPPSTPLSSFSHETTTSSSSSGSIGQGQSEEASLLTHDCDLGFFVSGAADGTVKLWSPRMVGAELRGTMLWHKGPVRSILSDERRVVVAGDDGVIVFFDKVTCLPLSILKGHQKGILCMRRLPAASRATILTGGADGLVAAWDERMRGPALKYVPDSSADERGQQPGHASSSSSAVFALDAAADGKMVASTGSDGAAHVWDLRSAKEVHRLEDSSSWSTCVKFLDSDSKLATGSHDWMVRVWDLNDAETSEKLLDHGGPVTALEWVEETKTLVSASTDGTVFSWRNDEDFFTNVGALSRPSNCGVVGLQVSASTAAICTSDNTMRFLSATSPALHSSSADGQAGKPPAADSWKTEFECREFPDMVRHMACDMVYGRMCSGGPSGTIRIWEPKASQNILVLNEV